MKNRIFAAARAIVVLGFFFTCQVMFAAPQAKSQICPRFAPGGVVAEPLDLFSSHGVLRVDLTYKTRVDEGGNTLYCFTTQDGVQSPTLHVRPGDELLISLKNDLPVSLKPSFVKHAMAGMPELAISTQDRANCGGMRMTDTSVNLHYHGVNAPPICHQDEVIKTMINSGESFQYDVHFPSDEPPGFTGIIRIFTASRSPRCKVALRARSLWRDCRTLTMKWRGSRCVP